MLSLTPVLLALLCVVSAGSAVSALQQFLYHGVGILGPTNGYGATFLVICTAAVIQYVRLARQRVQIVKSIYTQANYFEIASRVRDLAARLEISAPEVAVVDRGLAKEARVDFLRRHPVVVIPKIIAHQIATQPRMVEAILAHELSHIANGDARRAVIARLVVGSTATCIVLAATGIFALIATGNLIHIATDGFNFSIEVALVMLLKTSVSFLGYALLLMGCYSLLMQTREFYADRGAVHLGYQVELERLLTPLRSRNAPALFNVFSLHPLKVDRISNLRAIQSGAEITEFRFWPSVAVTVLAFGIAKLIFDNQFDSGSESAFIFAALPVMGAITILYLSLAYRHGKKIAQSERNFKLIHISRALGVGTSAVLTGCALATILFEIIPALEPEAPYDLLILDIFKENAGLCFAMIGAILGSLMTGAASTHLKVHSTAPRIAWITIAVTVCVATINLLGFIGYSIFFPQDKNQALEALSQQIYKTPLDADMIREWYGNLGAVAGLYFSIFFSILVFVIISRSAVRRYRVSEFFIILGLGSVFGFLAGEKIGEEYAMRESLWISCKFFSNPKHSDAAKLTEIRDTLILRLVDTARLYGPRNERLYVGALEDGDCASESTAVGRIPWYRTLMSLLNLTRDKKIHLALTEDPATPPTIVVTTYSKAAPEKALLVLADQGALLEHSLKIASPLRFALYLQGNLPLSDSRVDDAFRTAANSEITADSAAASMTLASSLRSTGQTDAYLRMLREILNAFPRFSAANAAMGDLMFELNKCVEATQYYDLVLGSYEFNAMRAQRAAFCSPNGTMRYVYSLRRRFAEDPYVLAYIGESAYQARKYSLADIYFDKAKNAEIEAARKINREVQRIGCVSLYTEMRKNISLCATPGTCTPPLDLKSGREHLCWAQHLRMYSKLDEARYHLRQSINLDPSLHANAIEQLRQIED